MYYKGTGKEVHGEFYICKIEDGKIDSYLTENCHIDEFDKSVFNARTYRILTGALKRIRLIRIRTPEYENAVLGVVPKVTLK